MRSDCRDFWIFEEKVKLDLGKILGAGNLEWKIEGFRVWVWEELGRCGSD